MKYILIFGFIILFPFGIANVMAQTQPNPQLKQQTTATTSEAEGNLQKQCLPNKEIEAGKESCDCAIGDEEFDNFMNSHTTFGVVTNTDKPITIDHNEGFILSRPAPSYPPLARAARAQGDVLVQMVINENGYVAAVKILSGHPLLRMPTLRAACLARFKPVLISGKAVNFAGTMTYQFKLQ